MFIDACFFSDLQMSIADGEYLIDRNAMRNAITCNSNLTNNHNIVVLFDCESVQEFCATEYFIVRADNEFILLAVMSFYGDPTFLRVVEMSSFVLYREAIQHMLNIKNN
jgi:hypothetical protein